MAARHHVECPPPRPDNLDMLHLANHAIEEIADSAVRAELAGEIPRMEYSSVQGVKH